MLFGNIITSGMDPAEVKHTKNIILIQLRGDLMLDRHFEGKHTIICDMLFRIRLEGWVYARTMQNVLVKLIQNQDFANSISMSAV